ncbi:MAG: hypothetical protein RLZZ168_180 [Cyanobacteriota bacterium]|jgi:hypothetical protein
MQVTANSLTPLLPSNRDHGFMGQAIDLTGQVFGRLRVAERAHSNNGVHWLCQCSCGKQTIVRGAVLRYGSTKSCGCGSKDQARANCEQHRSRNNWIPTELRQKLKHAYGNMLRRCYDPGSERYSHYGGRGIRVCDDWIGPAGRKRFYQWCIENGAAPDLQIDRMDVNGDYCPENCRFVDAIVQMNNTTRNRWITYNGETKTIADWARETGYSYAALKHRLDRGWSIERVFNQQQRRSER